MPKCDKNLRVIKVDLPEEVDFVPPRTVYPISKDELIYLYYDQQMSVREIAREVKMGATTIRRYMDKYSIPRRNYSDATITHYKKLREQNGSDD